MAFSSNIRTRTDPSKFDIVLVNENVYPPTNEIVATGVPSNKGSYTIEAHDRDLTTADNGYVNPTLTFRTVS